MTSDGRSSAERALSSSNVLGRGSSEEQTANEEAAHKSLTIIIIIVPLPNTLLPLDVTSDGRSSAERASDVLGRGSSEEQVLVKNVEMVSFS